MAENIYHLEPGYVFVSAQGSTIRTVVGSCIAVCLWDENMKYGGMNHFLYPRVDSEGKNTAQYGNVAIPALIKLLENLGCSKKSITAQIYGGGELDNSKNNSVGENNIIIARKILSELGIPIISEDVGGIMGRKIIFDTDTGHTVVLKVHKLRQTDWIEYHGS